MRYTHYARAGSIFYDDGAMDLTRQHGLLLDVDEVKWKGWSHHRDAEWYYLMSPRPGIQQGWKIHLSATLENHERVLGAAAEICWRRLVSFKFAPTRDVLVRRNSKYADRSGSGKFITIYPTSVDETEDLARELDGALGGEAGPYILSDVRFHNGPVYLRYGGFARRRVVGLAGSEVPAIEDPSGNLVPDVRSPQFTPPSWVEMPPFITACIDALGDGKEPADIPFSVERSLHFSNGGGVYLGHLKASGQRVVLKEARPYTGVTPDGRDAQDRLRNEFECLQELEETGAVPVVHGLFDVEGHLFLAEDYIEGDSLNRVIVRANPAIHANSTVEQRDAHVSRMLRIWDNLRSAVEAIHSRGFVLGDLHVGNVMVRESTEAVCLIDLEAASPTREKRPRDMGAPGFVPPGGEAGQVGDRYALACIFFSLFMPLTPLFNLDPSCVNSVVSALRSEFPEIPAVRITEVLQLLGLSAHREILSPAGLVPRDALSDWDAAMHENPDSLVRLMARGALECADFSRADRPFPADPAVFWTNGRNYAYGTAGVLDTFGELLGEGEALAEEWLLDSRRIQNVDDVGLLNGDLGVSITLARRGCREAIEDLGLHLAASTRMLPHSLESGLAGILMGTRWAIQNLPNSTFATLFDRFALLAATAARERLAEPISEDRTHVTGQGGLQRGVIGLSIALAAAGITEPNKEFAQLAEELLVRELEYTALLPDGSRQLSEPSRVLPYLATGGMGIAVAIYLLQKLPGYAGFLSKELEELLMSLDASFTIQSGLYNGRAGLILGQAIVTSGTSQRSRRLRHHISALAMHGVPFRTGIVFAGDQLMRCSTDFATGSAGIAHALAIATNTLENTQKSFDETLAELLPMLRPLDTPSATELAFMQDE